MDVVLLILFNHKYERNLPKLREIYAGRFSNLYFIMPFYKGNEEDVIGVYENSFYFQGYIAQALQRVKEKKFSHYIVIGDDLMLNPAINENNYATTFLLQRESGFIPEVFLLHDDVTPRRLMRKAHRWFWNPDAVSFRLDQKGIEIEKELPSVEEADKLLMDHGYEFYPYLTKAMLKTNYPKLGDENVNDIRTYLTHVVNCAIGNFKLNFKKKRTIHYPMVGSYSDIVIIPDSAVSGFIHYSGIMAALGLFVEIAIPTALLFLVKRVVQERQLVKKGLTLWNTPDVLAFEQKYHNTLEELFSNFPSDALYIHPVKLSKWK